MPVPKKESERKFEALRDKILARTGVSLKKAEEEVSQKGWEEGWESARDEALAHGRGRTEKIVKEVQRTGRLPLEKSAEDFDPFLVRVERFLGQAALRKEVIRSSRLAKYTGRTRDRLILIKSIERQNARTPAPNLAQSLRKERIRLIEDLLCVFAIRRGIA